MKSETFIPSQGRYHIHFFHAYQMHVKEYYTLIVQHSSSLHSSLEAAFSSLRSSGSGHCSVLIQLCEVPIDFIHVEKNPYLFSISQFKAKVSSCKSRTAAEESMERLKRFM